MKVIDLLVLISKGEEVPKKIKWGVHEFRWFVYEYKSIDELSEPTLLDYLSQAPHMLNDEIEIIEDKTKKIEKLKNTKTVYDLTLECEHEIEQEISNEELSNKINEIIDYINEDK